VYNQILRHGPKGITNSERGYIALATCMWMHDPVDTWPCAHGYMYGHWHINTQPCAHGYMAVRLIIRMGSKS
jgi:hypothetical protein